jgi:tRNA-uridine 2-sulfurtransferase
VPRVLLLFGGGLDSRLAHSLLEREGHEVVPLHFETGFVHAERSARVAALGIERLDVSREYLREVVLEPRHGTGAGLNACRDCRRFLLARALRIASARGIQLLATGDVPGQRPLDQSRAALDRADREAGAEGRVLRPLGAAALSVRGAGRRRQLTLARTLGIDPGPSASGGCCLLADRRFASRLRDLIEHRASAPPERLAIERLRVGRHYRLDWSAKLVVARDETESAWLARHAGQDWLAQAASEVGPVALLDGEPTGERGAIAAAIVLRHGPWRERALATVVMRRGDDVRTVEARPATPADLAARRL